MRLGLGLGVKRSRGAAAPAVQWSTDLSALTPGSLSAESLLALGSGGLVLTRASGAATVQTSASAVETGIAADTPRVMSDGTNVGLLIEETRTNDLTQSRAAEDTSAWAGVGSGVSYLVNDDAGPDGEVLADKVCVEATGYSPYFQNSVGTGKYTASLWRRARTTDFTHQWTFGSASGSEELDSSTATSTWERRNKSHDAGVGTKPYMSQAVGSGWSAACEAILQSPHIDFAQLELGAYPTSAIVSEGAAATRTGERLYHGTPASLIDSGRLGLLIAIRPLGAATEQGAAWRVWTIDASHYAEVHATTRVLTVVIGGVTRTLGELPTWTRGQLLEIWVAGGGGSATTVGSARVNGDSPTDLGSGAAQGTVSGSALDIACNGTANQLSGMITNIEAYRSGQKPAWAVAA